MTEKHYTWEEKIDTLVKLAKIIGVYLDVEREAPGSDGHKGAREQLKEVYEEFCQWRHDEPYVVDEIKTLIRPNEYTSTYTTIVKDTGELDYARGVYCRDDLTGTQMWVVDRAESEHPTIHVSFPKDRILSLEQMNEVMNRLQERASILPQHRIPPLKHAIQEEDKRGESNEVG